MRLILLVCTVLLIGTPGSASEPNAVPEKLVVLTFDDSVRSHYTVVRPILKEFKFGATFFITEGFKFKTDKKNYMTWEQIAQLHKDGFEIGNHTRDHMTIREKSLGRIPEQLDAIARQCKKYGIPKPTSFAYPGNGIHKDALALLKKQGIRFARRGGAPEYPYAEGRGFAFEPGIDHPLLIPSAGDARPKWTLRQFIRAVKQARQGRIAVLQFHGVPDIAHPWVHTDRDKFVAFMRYLAINKYKVIALRDLAKYVDADQHVPRDPFFAITDRQAMLKAKRLKTNHRTPKSTADLEYWLTNMVVDHNYSLSEVTAATGLPMNKIQAEIQRLKLASRKAQSSWPNKLKIRPYPGGRHPRIGFRDGALRPQRETKFSVFAPWKDGGYVVVDAPEAIWMNVDKGRQLLYLAHTHIDTYWSRQGIELAAVEWKRSSEGLTVTRRLPNKVTFTAEAAVKSDGVHINLSLHNGSSKKLTGLRVQNCVMLARLFGQGKHRLGFRKQIIENKLVRAPFIACHDGSKSKWVITVWTPNHNTWGNSYCPCMHSDPKFPDCSPGKTTRVKGWVGFYQGTEIEAHLAKLKKKWRE